MTAGSQRRLEGSGGGNRFAASVLAVLILVLPVLSASAAVSPHQIGLVIARSLRGVQLGLLNFDISSSLSCLPLLRVSL